MALKAKLASVVAKETKDGNADRISVFTVAFRSGEWAGVNENDTYDPASLLKVPIMIAYLQWAETNPSVLEQQFSYSGDDQNANEYFKSANDIRPGVAYTANDLLAHMIGNSDNNAALLLENSIPKDQLTKVYTDLKLSVPSGAAATPDYISAVQYAYFFRVLYNATYLDRFYSEKALDLLSLPDFTEGIVAGLPAKTVTAQKFGERSVVANNVLMNRELHDCGIVYKPNDPYLVCVMTQGTNFNALTGVIKDISALVYQNM
ncbi:MAG: serine hydrolase [Patescibacteria group bacterium]|nr:serine hydrolase [Patescibacteria group bacterium]